MPEAVGDADAYFDRLERWLDLESQAERVRMADRRLVRSRADAEKSGETLVAMRMVDHTTGLAGRLLLDFAKIDSGSLPMNRLKVGSPVVISDDGDAGDEGVAGVISRRTRDRVQVATERWPESEDHRFRIDLSPDETTRRRQLSAMARSRVAKGRTGRLRDVLLGSRPLRFDPMPDVEFVTPLNDSQRQAVRFALSARDVAVLHGPPGTGKTTTLAEVIIQAVRRGDRVLACAPSNTAVDNLLERLVGPIPNSIRFGHPARVFEGLRGHTLDELVENDPSNEVIREMGREVERLMRAAAGSHRSRDHHRRRGEMFAEAGRLRGEIRRAERAIVRGVLDSADVICTTTTIDEDLLGDREFDLVAMDEACQCTEPGVWQAVLRADRMVLAGDHCQLPPTVLSEEAAEEGLRRSLMERLVDREGEAIFRRLTVQYRMHEAIMRFSSESFYDSSLVADPSVATHRLCDLSGVPRNELTEEPMTFIDTAGAGYDESLEPDGLSKQNVEEAVLVTRLVHGLLAAEIDPDEIAVIAPYAAQVRRLRTELDIPGLEIDTVDGFQGREKEVVVLTMVRSNPTGEIGFLGDTRRTNVALTRARRKLIVVGDSATLGRHPFYERLLDHFEAVGAYRSVFEFSSTFGDTC